MKTIKNLLTIMIGIAIIWIGMHLGYAYINKIFPFPWENSEALQIIWGYGGIFIVGLSIFAGGYMVYENAMKLVARFLKKSGRL